MTDPVPQTSTPEQADRIWFEQTYQGSHQRQLTVRAVLMGGVLGMFMSLSNLYTTLKLGWSFGVGESLVAAVIAILCSLVGLLAAH